MSCRERLNYEHEEKAPLWGLECLPEMIFFSLKIYYLFIYLFFGCIGS